MQIKLSPEIEHLADAQGAADIVRSCVHCGFCLATCPTYQLLGDELDGPRGRIYLIKEVLEGAQPGRSTQLHLDRCLTCRACETTCPSGVQYGRLLDFGRHVVAARVDRPLSSRLTRALLKRGLTSKLFAPALRVAQWLRPLLPRAWRDSVPVRRSAGPWPVRTHARRVLLPRGCVQPALAPQIDAATARVLDRLQIEAVVPGMASCCGAIRHHLGDDARAEVRRNIDAWWPHVESGVEAIVINASGCGAMIKDYAHILRDDVDYAWKAARVVELARDLAELLPEFVATLAAHIRPTHERIVFHPPCSLQHAQQVRGAVEGMLEAFGVIVVKATDSHLCCGSAGTYSILQSDLARQLRTRKLAALQTQRPDLILSANIGCIGFLDSASRVPVRHWIEWVDARLA